MLGREVEAERSLEEHQEVIWFTYRSSIPISADIHSDVGWGCLVRVAQMAWAHALLRHFALLQKRIDTHYILTSFLEGQGPEFKYGIFRFLEMGGQLWRLRPGEWYTMTQAATTLEALHLTSPLKGSERLAIRVCHETVNVKQLLDVFGAPSCTCPTRRVDCHSCLLSRKTPTQPYFHKSLPRPPLAHRHIALILTTKLGAARVGKENYSALLELMSLPIFSGCLGGAPDKARFLTGRHAQRISYLDPHYVQPALDQLSLAKNMQGFRCREVRYMGREDLHPELALCFYLAAPTDLQTLLEAIDRIKTEEPFVRYEWESSDEF
mgnify:CR=1 FL=1